jgi:hypothetical protein
MLKASEISVSFGVEKQRGIRCCVFGTYAQMFWILVLPAFALYNTVGGRFLMNFYTYLPNSTASHLRKP